MYKRLSVNSESQGLVLSSRHATGLESFLRDIDSPTKLMTAVKHVEDSGNGYSPTHLSLLTRIQGVDCTSLFNSSGRIGLFVREVRIILKAHRETVNPGPSYTSIFEDKGMYASSDLGHNLCRLLMFYSTQTQSVEAVNVFRDAVRFNTYKYDGEDLTLLGLGLKLQSEDLVVTSLENGASICDRCKTNEQAYTVLQKGVQSGEELFVNTLLNYLPETLSQRDFEAYFGIVISYSYNLLVHSRNLQVDLSRALMTLLESSSRTSSVGEPTSLLRLIIGNNRRFEKHQAVITGLFISPKIPSGLKKAVIDSFPEQLEPFQFSLKQIFEAGE